MTTIPLHNPTSHHLFISTDDTEIVPNNLHPLWEHLSKDERSRVEYVANELVGLHEMEWLHPSNDHGPWRSAFEEAVNEAIWAALTAICPECVPGSIERVLDRAGLPSDALEFLPEHDHNGLKCRLSGTVIAAFRYGKDVEESVHSELFGWLEEYTDSLGNNLNELIENARTGSESAVMEQPQMKSDQMSEDTRRDSHSPALPRFTGLHRRVLAEFLAFYEAHDLDPPRDVLTLSACHQFENDGQDLLDNHLKNCLDEHDFKFMYGNEEFWCVELPRTEGNKVDWDRIRSLVAVSGDSNE